MNLIHVGVPVEAFVDEEGLCSSCKTSKGITLGENTLFLKI